jgi:hypothetical protein
VALLSRAYALSTAVIYKYYINDTLLCSKPCLEERNVTTVSLAIEFLALDEENTSLLRVTFFC